MKKLLSVKPHANPFTDDGGSIIGSITRNTATSDELVRRIVAGNSGVSEYTVRPVADMVKAQALSALASGEAVELFGLGTLYIIPSGPVEGRSPDASAVQGFTVRFTPSKEVLQSVGSIKADQVSFADATPQVDSMVNMLDGTEGAEFDAGKAVRLTSSHLRVAGADGGVFFTPVNDDAAQTPVEDESRWIAVAHLDTNTPRRLVFFLPDSLEAGTPYRIAIRTRFISGSRERKAPLTGYSPVVTVRA